MKNLLNGAISLVNLFRDGLFQSSHISCLAMTTRFDKEDSPAAASVRKGCGELFKPHTVSLRAKEAKPRTIQALYVTSFGGRVADILL